MTNSEYEIKALTGTSFEEIFEAHVLAFKDYRFQWSREALKKTLLRRGYDSSLSFGAYFGNELVSFTLNGKGEYHGISTAYDTGTGTIAEHRGKGLASRIFENSIPYLKNAGIGQYMLEVLEENQTAFSIYRKQGFEISRKFDCFRMKMADWPQTQNFTKNTHIELKEIDFGYLTQMEAFVDFNLSWQNNFQAILREPGNFKVVGAFAANSLVGYGVIEPGSGDIPVLAVNNADRRKGIGANILNELLEQNNADSFKIVNIESDQPAILSFLNAVGIPKIVSQFEMIKKL